MYSLLRSSQALQCTSLVRDDVQAFDVRGFYLECSSFLISAQMANAGFKTLSLTSGTAGRIFLGNFLSDLGLEPNKDHPYRVYVLLCEQDDDGHWGFYVGICRKAELEERLRAHAEKRGAAFTKERKPVALLYLHPASCLACEAYVYAACLAAISEESSVIRGSLGGWTQTFPTSRFGKPSQEQAKREWRMVHDRCLICNSSTHKATACTSQKSSQRQSSPSASHVALASSRNRSVSTAIPHAQPSTNRSGAVAKAQAQPAVPSDDARYDSWFNGNNVGKTNLTHHVVEDAWVPMNVTLPALKLSSNNAKRYLSFDSDTPRKLWRLGAKKDLPLEGRDWKMIQGRKGGGFHKSGGYHVRTKFLKKVVLEKFRHCLRY